MDKRETIFPSDKPAVEKEESGTGTAFQKEGGPKAKGVDLLIPIPKTK